MKVKIEFTIDVNVEAWVNTYGIPEQDVRQDVKDDCEAICRAHLDNLSLTTDPEPTPPKSKGK